MKQIHFLAQYFSTGKELFHFIEWKETRESQSHPSLVLFKISSITKRFVYVNFHIIISYWVQIFIVCFPLSGLWGAWGCHPHSWRGNSTAPGQSQAWRRAKHGLKRTAAGSQKQTVLTQWRTQNFHLDPENIRVERTNRNSLGPGGSPGQWGTHQRVDRAVQEGGRTKEEETRAGRMFSCHVLYIIQYFTPPTALTEI